MPRVDSYNRVAYAKGRKTWLKTRVQYMVCKLHTSSYTECSKVTSNRFKHILNEYGVDVVLPATRQRLLTTWTTNSFDSHHCRRAHELYFHLSSVYPCPWCRHISWWQSQCDLWHHSYNFQNTIAVNFYECFEILHPVCRHDMDSSTFVSFGKRTDNLCYDSVERNPPVPIQPWFY